MSTRQILLDTAGRVQAFLDENAALIGPNIAASRRNLDDAVAQVTAMAITQTGGIIPAKGNVARQQSFRASLRANFMAPVADIAKLKLSGTPEYPALKLPARQLAVAPLVAAAHAMADAAEVHLAELTDGGLPDGFIPQLRAAADAVTTSLDGRPHTVGSGNAAASLKAQEARIRSLFHLINALVMPKLGTDVTLLAKWKATKVMTPAHAVVTVPQAAAAPAAAPAPVVEPTPVGPAVAPATTTA